MRRRGDLRGSQRGQMSLPASTRLRWGLGDDGEVGYLDLGDMIVRVPGSVDTLRATLLASVADAEWNEARLGHGDVDLATE